MTGEQMAFGSALRRERERRGISLASVAESTKIQQSLLTSLERGDVSRWPSGLYRRAFLREYASAVGLPSESIVAEFLRLFPESGAAAPDSLDLPIAGSGLRLTLAPERRWSAWSLVLQATAALLDGVAVVATSVAIEQLLQMSLWTVIGILTVSYFSVATACLGRSPALWLMNAALVRRADLSKAQIRTRPSSRDLLHIVSTTPRPEARTPQHERPAQPFVEDARSVSR